MSRLPESEMTMPRTITALGFSPKSRNDAMPTQSRLVVTSAVLLATEVYSSEVIQVAKCSARKKPAPQVSRPCRRLSARSTWPDCQEAIGVMISAASPRRSVAMVSDGRP